MKDNLKTLTRLFLIAGLTAGMMAAPAAGAADAPAKKTARKSAVKHKPAAKAAEKNGPLMDDDDKEYKPGEDLATELDCELGNKLTLYRNTSDNEHMALRWQRRVHRMTRVSTTTGADRFENTRYGLVWIGIPAKGMLLDSKHGQQLANECKDAEQRMPKPASAATVTPTKPADLPPPVEAPRAEAPAKS